MACVSLVPILATVTKDQSVLSYMPPWFIKTDEKYHKHPVALEVLSRKYTGILKKAKKDEVCATGIFSVSPPPLRNFHYLVIIYVQLLGIAGRQTLVRLEAPDSTGEAVLKIYLR